MQYFHTCPICREPSQPPMHWACANQRVDVEFTDEGLTAIHAPGDSAKRAAMVKEPVSAVAPVAAPLPEHAAGGGVISLSPLLTAEFQAHTARERYQRAARVGAEGLRRAGVLAVLISVFCLLGGCTDAAGRADRCADDKLRNGGH